MTLLRSVFGFLRAMIKTLRLALPKLGVGWMFALLTINFNRISIVELNVPAVAITAMLALHYFLSPFQVIAGRWADRHPIFGLRRTPYFLLAACLGSSVFLLLPGAAMAMGAGNPLGFIGALALLAGFGVAIAVMGDTHHSLIAEVVPAKSRGGVISVVWTFTILSTIIASVIMVQVMPEYSPESMQTLYNMTPFIVIGSALLGLVGIERRLKREELAEALELAQNAAPAGNPIASAIQVLRENRQAWGFFAFIFIAIFSIFLQDNILEPFGAEVFGMSVGETSKFQQTWGGGVLVGMILMGIISVTLPVSKRQIALAGSFGTALGMFGLVLAAFTRQQELVNPALLFMGFFTGFFNVGALSMMMDMTITGATGLYMGLWGMAQAFGNGAASFTGGALHTGLIETQFMSPSTAYAFIFGIEAIGMVVAGAILLNLSVERFVHISNAKFKRDDLELAMESSLA